MRKIHVLLCTLALAGAQARVSMAAAGSKPETMKTEPVVIGRQFTIHSKACGNDRTVMISLPPDYEANPGRRYPVIVAVDGQWNFNQTGVAAGALSGNGLMHPMIVVAVHTLDRRDFYLLPERDPDTRTGGGADSLLAFIRDELIPFVDARYRTLPTRVLVGTSYGGVFVMHAFTSEPGLFDAFLTLSPSMWWNNGLMLKKTEAFLKSKAELRKALYVTVANEGQGMGVNALAEILKRTAPKGLAWRFEEYLNEVHGTISYKGAYDGLKFAFSDWRSDPVRFETRGDLLADGDTVTVEMASAGMEIRYTLDGSDPSGASVRYEKPLRVTRPVAIKAVPVFAFGVPGNPDSLDVRFLPKLKAETPAPERTAGLRFAYAEGNWDALPDPSKLKPIASGVATDFEMAVRKRDIHFSMTYTGFLEVPGSAVYRFFLTSDDGSRLELGGRTVVSNDGLHGMEAKSGKAYLEKGLHRVTIPFFQKDGGFGLQLEYESEGLPRQGIPLSAFSCPK
ncbi:chitobiase/beta-hexosaminidase C-terminal domain-containing protein [bacterium]|nr:chitobiase/beta-hexosaminidase C-terminal domain-containing protein [bacterium]